jgi:hypothetical protein
MKKQVILLFLAGIISHHLVAQNIDQGLAQQSEMVVTHDLALYVFYGAASFQMDDLKYLQETILDTYPVEGKITSSFPVFSCGSFGVVKQIRPSLKLSVGYSFANTGGRSYYADYSGSMQTDISAISHRFGVSAAYRIAGIDPLELSVFGRLDGNISRIETTTSVYVLGLSDGVYYDYRSFSPNFTGGLDLLYSFNQFSFGLEGGYLLDVPGKLNDKNTGSEVRDPNDRNRILTTDWTGFRAGVKFLLWLDW